MNEITFGIIGCGRIANRHANIINSIGKLIAVCDIDTQKADEFAKSYQAKAFYNIEELLANAKFEVAVICTPNGLHAVHSIAALNAGCHVLCEKPMAISVDDCKKMIEVAEKNNRLLFIVKQNRYNPPVVAVKKLLDENRLGKIFMADLTCLWNRDEAYYKNSWKGTKELDGGTLFTQFSHFIDLLYWYFGDVKNCSASLYNLNHKGIIDFEDCGSIILEFENGIAGSVNFSVNSYKKNMEGSLTIIAQNGTLKIGGEYLNELEYQHIKDYEIVNLPKGNLANNYGHYTGSMSNHELVYQNVVDVIINNNPIATTGFEGMKSVEIIEKIYKSAKINY